MDYRWNSNKSPPIQITNSTPTLPLSLQVKIWFQNHRYKCKRQAKEKAMAEQNQHNQVRLTNCLSG